MIKLFLKMYGLLIAILAASFVTQLYVMDWVWMSMPKADVAGRFTATFHLIDRELTPRPRAEWNAHLDELKKGFRTPATLEPMDRLRERFAMPPYQVQKLASGQVVSFDREAGGFYMARRVADSDVATLLELPGPPSQRNFFNLLNWGIEMAIVAVLLAFWIRPFWRDLNNLNAAAQAAGSGDFSVRAKVGRISPLQYLAEGINSMTTRVSELLSAHRQLTTAVSHELRNPLMRLRFRQSLAHDATTLEEKNRNLDEMSAALDELDQLVEEMLTYARTKNPGQDIELAPTETASWLAPLESNARALAQAQGSPVRIEIAEVPERIEIEPVFMARALSNLLSNAVRYAGGIVRLSIQREAGRHVLRVDDDGPGVAEADRERVFEPFWRGDQSRSRKTGGFGIGLALVRRIARWHGGDAVVLASPLGGARFEMAWPIKDEALND
jgi:two-component system, OmpR family, sensor kinase ParS